MKIKLYQINLDRDTESRAFMSWEWIAQKTENITDIDSSIYDCVFDGEIDGNSLEDAFAAFNFDHPDGFQGRSMSVSDIVVIEAEDGTTSAHFCDTIGFQQVEFDTEAAPPLKENITVVILEPGEMARVGTIEATLAGMQDFVGGYIEACYPFEEEVCIVCNEEGKINGLPLNRAIYAEPEEVEMTYTEMRNLFHRAEDGGKHITGYVVFSQESFTEPYSELSRTYAISSDNKAFQSRMGGYSIYGYCMDGSDPCVRLEQYMAAEYGGKDGWKIERCYMKSDTRQMIDIIAGPFFICDCSGENFGSLTEEQTRKYVEMFQCPEMFFRVDGEIKAIPFRPEKEQER